MWWCAKAVLVFAASAMVAEGLGEDIKDALDGAVSIKSQEAVGHVPVVETTAAVPWAAAPIRIDGDLSDWRKADAAVVLEGEKHATWYRGTYGGKDDLSASVRLCRDEKNLYLAMEISDDRLPAADRINVAFADAKSPLVLGWRDVGQRYGADDVHLIFVIGKNGDVGMHWAHVQQRMDYSLVQNSFGTEAERRAHVEEGSAAPNFQAKIFAKSSRRVEGGKTVTSFEAAFPWKNLAPYVPVSYAPLKFNVLVEDRDDRAGGQDLGGVAWTPGLMGTYSAAHFANLTFQPRAERKTVEGYAQLPTFNYINQNIVAGFAFYNPGEARSGELQLLAAGDDKPLATTKISLPPGASRKDLAVHSEKVGPGRKSLVGRLKLEGAQPLDIPVMVPSADDKVAVQAVAEFEAKIATLEKNAATLTELYEKVKAAGLDPAYPKAYLTLQQMFIPRCRADLKAGDAPRVKKNTEMLEKLFVSSKAYMEEILAKPAAQLKVPPRFDPDKLTMKNGYYFDGNRPVFLWGPCTFWFLRQDQPLVIGLGFNSVCPETPQDRSNKEVLAHMETWTREGVSMNASMHVPGLQLTGADAAKSALLKANPEMKNLDPNNFLPFVVQHPAARQAIVEGFTQSVAFWRDFSGVRSYWLWNEPWYLNYSEMTRQDFINQYLKPRYRTVDALNKRWKSQYASFDQIKLIDWPDPANYAPWYDFQQFRDGLLADFFAFLNKTSKALDPRRPTHTKFMAASLHSFNIEKFQSVYDIAGHDGSISDRDIPFLDLCRSVYPDHPLVNTEVHISYAGKKAVEMVPWRLALHGLADGNWWCWHSNQRFSDSLANAESMCALSIAGLDIQRLFDPYIYALNQKATPVATLFPDVVERRSDLKMVRLRFELAAPQYYLGVRPFYATETRIAEGELPRHKLLLAGESDYVKDSTYTGVLDYVKGGGRVIVTRGGFAHNEYGDARDTGELIKLEGGSSFGEGARIYPLGRGQVICIDEIASQPDVVTDGGQCLRGGPLPENTARGRVYQRVLAKAMADGGLDDAVRIVARDGAQADALFGMDWRSVEANGGYTLAVLPYDTQAPFNVKLVTAKPVRRIVNLITGKEVVPAAFELADGPNLFQIELEK